jgi:broad specificity phosphatase PhoE
MTTHYLVRHAKPAATWGEATDPGLDATGVAQAEQTANELRTRLPQVSLYTSPMRRCVETAQPLARLWQVDAALLPEVAEIPSPPLSMQDKQQWLAAGMQGTWSQLQARSPAGSPDFLAWRETLLNKLRNLKTDSVIYTHYVAINVVVGAAQGHDRVLSFRPGHASVTAIDVIGQDFVIRQLGVEADGGVLLGK